MTLPIFAISLFLIVLGAGLLGYFFGPKLQDNRMSDEGSAEWFARRMKRRLTFSAVNGVYLLLVIALVVFVYPLGCMLGVPWNVLDLSPQSLFTILFAGGGVLLALIVVLYSRRKE